MYCAWEQNSDSACSCERCAGEHYQRMLYEEEHVLRRNDSFSISASHL